MGSKDKETQMPYVQLAVCMQTVMQLPMHSALDSRLLHFTHPMRLRRVPPRLLLLLLLLCRHALPDAAGAMVRMLPITSTENSHKMHTASPHPSQHTACPSPTAADPADLNSACQSPSWCDAVD